MHDQRESESRARAHEAPHWAVVLWLNTFPEITLTPQQQQLIAEQVTNQDAWMLTRQDYMGSPRWKRDNIGNVIDRYQRHVKELTHGSNDLSPSVAGPGSRRARNGHAATDWNEFLKQSAGSAGDEE